MTTRARTPDGGDQPRRAVGEAMEPMVISFVARSGSGKTTVLERLVPELKAMGFRVGVLKHHAHATPFDSPGKDTYRLAQAGADVVIGACAVQTAVFIPGDASADLEGVIRRHCVGLDLVLTEGYKRGNFPKVEVHRASRAAAEGAGAELLCSAAELIAVVTDEPLALPDSLPQFDLEDASGLARWLAQYLTHRAQTPPA